MSISVVTIIKNAIKQGYCFVDSILSTLPFADEIIISEGYSDDKTLSYLNRLSKKYDKIKLFQDEWESVSYHGEVISKVSERAIKKAKGDWIFYLQCDEIIHEETSAIIRELCKSRNINSVSFPFYHFIRAWEPEKKPAYKDAIRLVKNKPGISLSGDGWTFDGNIYPIGYNLIPKPTYHFAWVFPEQNRAKDIEHSKIYTNIPEYTERMRKACVESIKNPYPRTDFDDFPELSRRFIGKYSYEIPEI